MFASGIDVVLVSRGMHGETIQRHGLRVETPDGSATFRVPTCTSIGDVQFLADDVVFLTTKGQDSQGALERLALSVSPTTAIVCAQNGVENERLALRYFHNVYAGSVWCPTARLVPGVVRAYSAPTTGRIDVGRFPSGIDDVATEVAAALRKAGFASEADSQVMRWKYAKLLMNLGNAVEAACGKESRFSDLSARAMQEGEACCRAAGIPYGSEEEMKARIQGIVEIRPVQGEPHPGGSTWQSLKVGAESVETDYLNGEIALLGRMYAVPTPINDLLQSTVRTMVAQRMEPGAYGLAHFDEALRPRV